MMRNKSRCIIELDLNFNSRNKGDNPMLNRIDHQRWLVLGFLGS